MEFRSKYRLAVKLLAQNFAKLNAKFRSKIRENKEQRTKFDEISFALLLHNTVECIQKRALGIICPRHCHNDIMELANIVSIMLSDQYS